MSASLAIVVLAAGKGTRMQSALPKVLHPVAGRTLLAHTLHTSMALEPKHLIVVTGSNMEDVQQEARACAPGATCIVQDPPQGTGHAVQQIYTQQALPEHFDGIVLVVYADTPLLKESTLRTLVQTIQSGQSDLALLTFTPEDPAQYGRVICNEAGKVSAIVEWRDATEKERAITLCNSGVIACHGAHLPGLLGQLTNHNAKKEYYLTDIVTHANQAGFSCQAHHAEDPMEVMGINTQAERAKAEHHMQQRLHHQAMEQGVTLIAPETVYFSADTSLAPGTIVHPHVVFGPGVTVTGPATIHAFSHVEEATIATGASIGPYARLRPHTHIEEDVKIGTFVEVKKSTLKPQSKVSHLSYIGDSTIGHHANIGGGTITCNYDGVQKYPTTIEEGAFIGSNTSLIAPLTIGADAIIGAGSTITKDVPSNALVTNDMPQKTHRKKASDYRNASRKEKQDGGPQ